MKRGRERLLYFEVFFRLLEARRILLLSGMGQKVSTFRRVLLLCSVGTIGVKRVFLDGDNGNEKTLPIFRQQIMILVQQPTPAIGFFIVTFLLFVLNLARFIHFKLSLSHYT